jgi:hypothetical protein
MERSIDTILEWFSQTVQAKKPIPPTSWIEAGEFLNVMIGNENDKLCELEQKVALEKLSLMEKSQSVAEAKMKVEATDIYKEAKRQKNKIAQIIEFIRLAKLHARIYSEELKGN